MLCVLDNDSGLNRIFIPVNIFLCVACFSCNYAVREVTLQHVYLDLNGRVYNFIVYFRATYR